jgi:hypothetical protein
MTGFSESMVEAAALGWFQALGIARLMTSGTQRR